MFCCDRLKHKNTAKKYKNIAIMENPTAKPQEQCYSTNVSQDDKQKTLKQVSKARQQKVNEPNKSTR